MYSAVVALRSVMERSPSTAAASEAEPSSRNAPSCTAFASAWMERLRLLGTPTASSLAVLNAYGVGNT
jgi:hypothetical protein